MFGASVSARLARLDALYTREMETLASRMEDRVTDISARLDEALARIGAAAERERRREDAMGAMVVELAELRLQQQAGNPDVASKIDSLILMADKLCVEAPAPGQQPAGDVVVAAAVAAGQVADGGNF